MKWGLGQNHTHAPEQPRTFLRAPPREQAIPQQEGGLEHHTEASDANRNNRFRIATCGSAMVWVRSIPQRPRLLVPSLS